MKTILIDNDNGQATALINYLKTLPFVTFPEDSAEETEVKSERTEVMPPVKSPDSGIAGEVEGKKLLVDLRKSLSLNDRFRFQKDLFNGNADEMNEALEHLNSFTSFSEAWNYIENNYEWSPENESVVEFRYLLEKKHL